MWISVILKILHAPHNLRYTHLSETTDLWIFHLSVDSTWKHIHVLNKGTEDSIQYTTQLVLEKFRNLKYWKGIKVKVLHLILVFCNSIVTSINLGCFWGNPLLYLEVSLLLSSSFLYNCSLGTVGFVSFASLQSHLHLTRFLTETNKQKHGYGTMFLTLKSAFNRDTIDQVLP